MQMHEPVVLGSVRTTQRGGRENAPSVILKNGIFCMSHSCRTTFYFCPITKLSKILPFNQYKI